MFSLPRLPARKTSPPAGQLSGREGGKGRTGSGKEAARVDAAHASTTGRLSSASSKALLYDAAADAFRDKETVLDSFAAITQVGSGEGSTLRSPERMHDDQVDNNALAASPCQLISPSAPCPTARPARLRASFQAEMVGNGALGQGRQRPGRGRPPRLDPSWPDLGKLRVVSGDVLLLSALHPDEPNTGRDARWPG